MHRVAAEREQANVREIAAARRERTVVRLENRAEVVVIESEYARLRGVYALAPRLRVCRIAGGRAVPASAVHLKRAARGHGGHEGEVAGGLVICRVHAVETAPDIGPAEAAQQALVDAVALEGGQSHVPRRHLGAVSEVEA